MPNCLSCHKVIATVCLYGNDDGVEWHVHACPTCASEAEYGDKDFWQATPAEDCERPL